MVKCNYTFITHELYSVTATIYNNNIWIDVIFPVN